MEAEPKILQSPSEWVKPTDPLEEKINQIPELIGSERWVKEEIDKRTFSVAALDSPVGLLNFKKRRNTSYHEAGHETVANAVGKAMEISVVPKGRVGGYVRWMVNKTKEFKDQLFDVVTVSVASFVAEEMCGITDHGGCGSDMGKARFAATLIYRLSKGAISTGGIIDQAISRARGLLVGSGGASYIMRRGDQVNREQTLGMAA